MGASKSSTYFTHSLPPLPSYQFLCSTWNPVSSPRPTRVGGRRAQGLSRSAVALAWRHARALPDRALPARSAAARLLWPDDTSEGSSLSGHEELACASAA